MTSLETFRIPKQKLSKKIKYRKLLLMCFVLPSFLFHLFFIVLPSGGTLYYSFFNWNGIAAPVFNGIDNYKELVRDKDFYWAVTNNFRWIACFMTIPVILGLVVAVLVSRLKKTQMLLRTIYFLPYIIAAPIASRIWSSYMNPYFGINTIFRQIGMENLGKMLWLGDPSIALYSVAFVDIWHFWGFPMVLFLGALQQIDPILYESSRVEGATKVQEFMFITIPSIMPTIVFVVITIIMWSFLTFDYVWVMTGGGPGNATELVSTLVYRTAFMRYRTGYASALCIVQSFLSVLAYIMLQVVKKKGWDV